MSEVQETPVQETTPIQEVAAVEQPLEAQPEQKPETVKEEVKPQPNIKTFKLNVNGKTKEVKLDLNNDKDLEKYLNLAEASDEKFQEAAKTKKQVENLVKELKNNPLAILKHKDLGIDVKKLAAQILEEEHEEAKLTPEQKQLREMESKLKAYEEEKKKLEEERTAAELEKARTQAMNKFDEELTEALSGQGLPKSAYVVKRTSDLLLEAMSLTNENGEPLYPNVSVKDIVPIVQEQITNELKEMFSAAPDEVVEALLGNKLNSMRKNRVAKAKASPPKIEDTGAKTESKKDDSEDRISFNKFFSPF